MTESEIKGAVFRGLEKIAPEADFSALSPDENVRNALDIDSYDFLNFLIGLNKELGIEVPEADYGKIATLNGMINYLSAGAR